MRTARSSSCRGGSPPAPPGAGIPPEAGTPRVGTPPGAGTPQDQVPPWDQSPSPCEQNDKQV